MQRVTKRGRDTDRPENVVNARPTHGRSIWQDDISGSNRRAGRWSGRSTRRGFGG
jgi:hypothetical protein